MKEYICYIGFYSNVDVIMSVKNKLKDKGFETILKETDGIYYLQIFSSPNKRLVENMITLLVKHGFHANMFNIEINENCTDMSV